MRYVRYAFLALLAICLIVVALANREPVTLRLMTDELAGLMGISTTVTLPLFIVIFGGVIAGILIGFVWEWFREHRQRSQANLHRREKERLEKEVGRLREKDAGPADDVLALLERNG